MAMTPDALRKKEPLDVDTLARLRSSATKAPWKARNHGTATMPVIDIKAGNKTIVHWMGFDCAFGKAEKARHRANAELIVYLVNHADEIEQMLNERRGSR